MAAHAGHPALQPPDQTSGGGGVRQAALSLNLGGDRLVQLHGDHRDSRELEVVSGQSSSLLSMSSAKETSLRTETSSTCCLLSSSGCVILFEKLKLSIFGGNSSLI